jgi:hypothetical protein
VSKRGEHRVAGGPRFAAAERRQRTSTSLRPLDDTSSALASSLRERLPELEAAIANRVCAIADPTKVDDPIYPQRLGEAMSAAIDFTLTVMEAGERRGPGIPPAVLSEARVAARSGVPLETVMHRYFAANTLLGDFLVEEAERTDSPSSALRVLMRRQATSFERVVEAATEEHGREAKAWPSSGAERRRECVKSLLAGELVDHSELGYDLDAHHLGVMAKGDGAPEAMRMLAERLDRRLLAVCREEEPVWACWLGGRTPVGSTEALGALEEIPLDRVFVTVGEPAEGIAGWRQSHRQAKAALPIAERRGQAVLRYADVILSVSILRDDLVAASLRQVYLRPLEGMRDGGRAATETLRAYFSAERNISSTAAALGVDRRTVTNRIRAIEDLFGRPLAEFATDLEIALRIGD